MTDLHDDPPEPHSAGELFLDFVNTAELTNGQPVDHVARPVGLRDWLAGRGLVGGSMPAAEVEARLDDFLTLRDLARRVVERLADGEPPTRTQVRGLNRAMRDGVHHHELRTEPGGTRFTVRQIGNQLDQARSAIAGSLAHYLADHETDRLRVCANNGCRWVFVDHSPGGRRRWCDMSVCGNRAKVARHRARRREGQATGR